MSASQEVRKQLTASFSLSGYLLEAHNEETAVLAAMQNFRKFSHICLTPMQFPDKLPTRVLLASGSNLIA